MKAKEILGITFGADSRTIESQYDRYRDLYFPMFEEIKSSRNERRIKDYMRECFFIDADEDVDYYFPSFAINDKGEQCAPSEDVLSFLKFGEVCDAYHSLKKDTDYPEYPLSPEGFEKANDLRLGKGLGMARKFLRKFASISSLTMILIMILLFVFPGNYAIRVPLLSTLLVIYIVQWLCTWIYAPLNMLLLIPKCAWKGMRWGMDVHLWFVWPILPICGAICGVLGVAAFLFFPGFALSDRDKQVKSSKKYRNYCNDIVNRRYERICREIEEFRQSHEYQNYESAKKAFCYFKNMNPDELKKRLEYARLTVLENNQFLAELQQKQVEEGVQLLKTVEKCEKKSDRTYKIASFLETFAADELTVHYLDDEINDTYDMMNKRNTEKGFSALKNLELNTALLNITINRIQTQAMIVLYEDIVQHSYN